MRFIPLKSGFEVQIEVQKMPHIATLLPPGIGAVAALFGAWKKGRSVDSHAAALSKLL